MTKLEKRLLELCADQVKLWRAQALKFHSADRRSGEASKNARELQQAVAGAKADTPGLVPEPALRLQSILVSIVVHAEEFRSPGGHAFDAAALDALLQDAQLAAWLANMREQGLAPVKRA